MLVYKVLYKKMMDDLKDSGMWLDWAEKLLEEQPEVAKYLYTSAKQRIETGYPETKKLFEALCTSSDKCCMNELIDEQLDGWHDELVMKVQKLGSK